MMPFADRLSLLTPVVLVAGNACASVVLYYPLEADGLDRIGSASLELTAPAAGVPGFLGDRVAVPSGGWALLHGASDEAYLPAGTWMVWVGPDLDPGQGRRALTRGLESAFRSECPVDVERGPEPTDATVVGPDATSSWSHPGAAADGDTWFYQVPAVAAIRLRRSGGDIELAS